MTFKIGPDTEAALGVALKHEFLRCEDAFTDFATSATIMILHGENKRIAYKTYNAYARFVHHLYEFMLGAISHDSRDSRQLTADLADCYITSHTQRILTNRRKAILKGTAPAWENHISYYPEKVPPRFANDFRRCRNIASGHVTYKRPSLSLTAFYNRYHKFLYLLYYDAKAFWGQEGTEFPDLKEITSFSMLLRDEPPPPPREI